MNTKFTILVAAGLLFAGITQAQGTVAADKADFNNPRHAVVREHQGPQHQVRHHKKHVKHHHKTHRHHKMNHHN